MRVNETVQAKTQNKIMIKKEPAGTYLFINENETPSPQISPKKWGTSIIALETNKSNIDLKNTHQ